MKRLILVPLAFAISLSLVSCFWVAETSTGSLQLDFSGLQARQPGDVARVYLIADGLLFSTGGGVPFAAEVAVPDWPNSSVQVSIDGLPVGPTYRAMVGVGQVTGDIFAVSSAGESATFEVTQGSTTSAPVVMDNPYYFSGIYFSSDLMGRYLKGVVGGGGMDAYTADESKVYLAYLNYDSILFTYVLSLSDQYDLAKDPDDFGVRSHRVNSLSDDRIYLASDAFVNSDRGIVPFYGGDGWNFDPAFSAELPGDDNILESGSISLSQDRALFFRRSGGVGGRYFPYMLSPEPWVNVNTSGVLDMVLSDNSAYFAAADGAFALPPAFLRDATPTLAEHRVTFSAPAPILSLGFQPSFVAPGGTLFMGTTGGAYTANVDESSGISIGTPSVLPEIPEDRIEKVEISRDWPDINQAYLSRYWLYIRKYGIVYKFPFFAVVPGKATGMAWDSSGVLYISGTEGLSALWVGAC